MSVSKVFPFIGAVLVGLFATCCATSPTAHHIPDFQLSDQSGRAQSLNALADKKAVVLVTHVIGCPMVAKSYEKMAVLQKQFSNRGVAFFYLNASPQDTRSELGKEAKDYSVDVPILKDDSQAVARHLAIQRSAEAIVIVPPRWQVAYRGPLDDQFDYLGGKTENVRLFLSDALSDILAGRQVRDPHEEVKGCLIDVESGK